MTDTIPSVFERNGTTDAGKLLKPYAIMTHAESQAAEASRTPTLAQMAVGNLYALNGVGSGPDV
jgi:hypothetical protein